MSEALVFSQSHFLAHLHPFVVLRHPPAKLLHHRVPLLAQTVQGCSRYREDDDEEADGAHIPKRWVLSHSIHGQMTEFFMSRWQHLSLLRFLEVVQLPPEIRLDVRPIRVRIFFRVEVDDQHLVLDGGCHHSGLVRIGDDAASSLHRQSFLETSGVRNWWPSQRFVTSYDSIRGIDVAHEKGVRGDLDHVVGRLRSFERAGSFNPLPIVLEQMEEAKFLVVVSLGVGFAEDVAEFADVSRSELEASVEVGFGHRAEAGVVGVDHEHCSFSGHDLPPAAVGKLHRPIHVLINVQLLAHTHDGD